MESIISPSDQDIGFPVSFAKSYLEDNVRLFWYESLAQFKQIKVQRARHIK